MNKSNLMIAAGTILIVLSGCKTNEQLPSTDAELFSMARNAILARAKDPDSTKFGPMVRKQYVLMGGETVVCGTVNGKNSYGGYTGPQLFAYRVAADELFVGAESTHGATFICSTSQ